MCTAVCSFVYPSARVHNPRVYLQRALHINKRLCTQANGSARMHRPAAHVQSAVFICKVVCLYAAPRVHVQQRLHMCTAVFICRSLCTCAQPSCLFVADLACVQGGVFICKGPCIYGERRVELHASVLVYSAVCLFVRPDPRMHGSRDDLQCS